MSSRTNITASEKEIIENVAEKTAVKPLTEKEIELVRSTIGGMTEQEQKLAAETLPIGLLFERIQNEVVVTRQKLDRITAIINE